MKFFFCDDTRRKWWELRNPRDLWSSKDSQSDRKKSYYCCVLYLLKQQVRCGKCCGFISPHLKFNSACRSTVKCGVDVEFETEFFADQGELKFIDRSSEYQEDSVTCLGFVSRKPQRCETWLKGFSTSLACLNILSHVVIISVLCFPVSLIKQNKKKDKLWSRVSQLGWQKKEDFFPLCTLGYI